MSRTTSGRPCSRLQSLLLCLLSLLAATFSSQSPVLAPSRPSRFRPVHLVASWIVLARTPHPRGPPGTARFIFATVTQRFQAHLSCCSTQRQPHGCPFGRAFFVLSSRFVARAPRGHKITVYVTRKRNGNRWRPSRQPPVMVTHNTTMRTSVFPPKRYDNNNYV